METNDAKIERWMVVKGNPVLTATTRGRMRSWIKEKRNKGSSENPMVVHQYFYAGKVIRKNGHRYFIVDLLE